MPVIYVKPVVMNNDCLHRTGYRGIHSSPISGYCYDAKKHLNGSKK